MKKQLLYLLTTLMLASAPNYNNISTPKSMGKETEKRELVPLNQLANLEMKINTEFLPEDSNWWLQKDHTYQEITENVENARKLFAAKYETANDSTKPQILKEARDFLEETIIEQILPKWEGTPYKFGGRADIPYDENPVVKNLKLKNSKKKKKTLETGIDCGSFIEEALTDAGFRLPERIGQYMGTTIISTVLQDPGQYTVITGKNAKFLEDYLLNAESSIHHLGLATHNIFVIRKDGKLYMTHAKLNKEVTEEPIYKDEKKRTLQYSLRKTRDFHINNFLNDGSVERWIQGMERPKTDYYGTRVWNQRNQIYATKK